MIFDLSNIYLMYLIYVWCVFVIGLVQGSKSAQKTKIWKQAELVLKENEKGLKSTYILFVGCYF